MDISLKMLPWNKRIEMLRVLKGWTQKETAEKCNTNQKYIGIGRLEKLIQEKIVK